MSKKETRRERQKRQAREKQLEADRKNEASRNFAKLAEQRKQLRGRGEISGFTPIDDQPFIPITGDMGADEAIDVLSKQIAAGSFNRTVTKEEAIRIANDPRLDDKGNPFPIGERVNEDDLAALGGISHVRVTKGVARYPLTRWQRFVLWLKHILGIKPRTPFPGTAKVVEQPAPTPENRRERFQIIETDFPDREPKLPARQRFANWFKTVFGRDCQGNAIKW